MAFYGKVLSDLIEREKAGMDYRYPASDRATFLCMLEEINQRKGTNFSYLAEIDAFDIPGAGLIMEKYVRDFESEGIRAYLVPQMVSDKVRDCDKLVLELYLHFKQSDFYVKPLGQPDSAYIYVRYDNAFRRLKPKRLKRELMELVAHPLDAYYLPFTVRMVSSWKMPEMEHILFHYADPFDLREQDLGLVGESERISERMEWRKRQLQFSAIHSLRYYPSERSKQILHQFFDLQDRDFHAAAKKSLEYIGKRE